MNQRTAEDMLREEYCLLSPEIKRVVHQLQTHVSYLLLPVTLDLKHHEPRDPELMRVADKLVLREGTERVYDAFDELESTLERELQRGADLAMH